MMIALTPRIPICRTAQYFNPHFRKGSDRAAAIYRMPGKYFNPHFRKGSDGVGTVVPLDANYFNPHFRKGSDNVATNLCSDYCRNFNPHFRKGSDISRLVIRLKVCYFNPHFRKGSDDYLISSEWLSKNISIHTSAREVTGSTPEMCKGSGISIHTSAREVTQHKTKVQNIFSHFNPHFRKGSDGYLSDIQLYGSYFNPHFRKGSDRKIQLLRFIFRISIHTSAREVTYIDHKQILNEYISIHTSAREVTDIPNSLARLDLISIHTSAREVTAADSFIPSKALDFNPHFRKGSDNKITGKVNTMENFNPHFRKGSDADDPG